MASILRKPQCVQMTWLTLQQIDTIPMEPIYKHDVMTWMILLY